VNTIILHKIHSIRNTYYYIKLRDMKTRKHIAYNIRNIPTSEDQTVDTFNYIMK